MLSNRLQLKEGNQCREYIEQTSESSLPSKCDAAVFIIHTLKLIPCHCSHYLQKTYRKQISRIR